jgi:hypothetical protein
MSWFSSERKNPVEESEVMLGDGVFSSPGLEMIVKELEKAPPSAILELGAPSNETLHFFGNLGHQVVVQDLFRGRSADRKGTRQLQADEALPEAGEFALILVWDLLHYFDASARRPFGVRLEKLAAPGALALVMASSSTPIPPSPIHFHVKKRGSMRYQLEPGPRLEPPRFNTRDALQTLPGFVAERIFQLRNGLQELVLRRNG